MSRDRVRSIKIRIPVNVVVVVKGVNTGVEDMRVIVTGVDMRDTAVVRSE